MKAEVASQDRVRKSIEVTPDEAKVTELREEIFGDLRQRAKIKGFRPGKVPRSVIQSFYKDYIEDELRKKVVETTMMDALRETNVNPVTEPRIRFRDGENAYAYSMEVEIVPEFELPAYEGIQIEAEKIKLTDEEIAKRVESIREMHAQLVTREADEPARKGDLAVIKYEAFHDGKPAKDVKSDSYPVDLGSSSLMPEFEEALVGMKANEEKEVELTFPADYPDKNIASKTLLFKVLIKEIKEKRLPELNDEFAKDLSFENMEQLRAEVKKELEKEKEASGRKGLTEQIVSFLVEKTDLPVPSGLLEKRLDVAVRDAKARMRTDDLPAGEERTFDAALRKEYEPETEKRIKAGMILTRIAKDQGIDVTDSDADQKLREIAEETKRAYDNIREFYDKYGLLDSLKNSMLEEKTLNFLLEKATVKEKE
jgi:trigger factor